MTGPLLSLVKNAKEIDDGKKDLLIVAAMMALSLIAFAAAKPNFSGTWTMDRARSFGLPGDMNQTLTITQRDDQIELETKLIQPNNERTVKDTYMLDGKEYDFTPAPLISLLTTASQRQANSRVAAGRQRHSGH